MSESYYSARRAASREQRRIKQMQTMSVISAVCCLVAAIVIAVFSLISIAKANRTEAVDPLVSEQPVEAEPVDSVPDGYPLFGEIPVKFDKQPNTEKPYDDYDLELLALVIYQEAGGNACSDETRRMVAEVVLNRVDHPYFPNSIEGVLLQYGQYGRLYWTGIKWPDRASYEVEKNAVERAYRIAEIVLTADNRLLPGDVIFQAEFPQGKETVAQQDGLYFCR